MAWRECKRKLERVEACMGRQPDLRRQFNKALRAGEGAEAMSKKLDSMWTPTFTEEDYRSGDGFQTAAWGAAAWHYLHITSLNYTPEKKEQFKTLLDGFAGTLPCIHCRNNFPTNLAAAKARMAELGHADVWGSREAYSRWIYELHNEVNKMLGKCRKNQPTYSQMRDELENFRSRCLTPEEVKRREEKEGGCVDSPYGADAKARLVLTFVPRKDTDLEKVRSINIDPRCRVERRSRPRQLA